MKKIDPIKLEVIRHAFIAAAEEMKTNLNDIIGWYSIVHYSVLIWDLLIFDEKIYISYLNEVKKDCYNVSILEGKLYHKKILFKKT